MGTKKADVLQFNKKSLAKRAINASNIDINASLDPGIPALAEDDLRVAVQRILFHGTYVECSHSSEDRAYRNISDDDIEVCLSGPWKLTGVEKTKNNRDWKYKITGRDIEREELSLVIIVDTETQQIKVVTKF